MCTRHSDSARLRVVGWSKRTTGYGAMCRVLLEDVEFLPNKESRSETRSVAERPVLSCGTDGRSLDQVNGKRISGQLFIGCPDQLTRPVAQPVDPDQDPDQSTSQLTVDQLTPQPVTNQLTQPVDRRPVDPGPVDPGGRICGSRTRAVGEWVGQWKNSHVIPGQMTKI